MDVPGVQAYADTLPNVVFTDNNLFTCSQDTQEDIKKKIKDEPPKTSNTRGTVSFAKAGPNSRTTQFFINLVDNTALDYPNRGGYCVFGKVVEGMDVVDNIAKTATKCPSRSAKCRVGPGLMDVPENHVVINKAQRKKPAQRK